VDCESQETQTRPPWAGLELAIQGEIFVLEDFSQLQKVNVQTAHRTCHDTNKKVFYGCRLALDTVIMRKEKFANLLTKVLSVHITVRPYLVFLSVSLRI
jgi:hypothetical protein